MVEEWGEVGGAEVRIGCWREEFLDKYGLDGLDGRSNVEFGVGV